MRLRGTGFGCVLDASGARGFFGEGYWYHRWIPGLNFKGATFVAKTTTLNARAGNMPLREDWTPVERRPKCVAVDVRKGIALNAVGLSGPGAEALFAKGEWQKRTEPFFLSFMPVENDRAKKMDEVHAFAQIFRKHLPSFNAPVALQVNLSCPNVGHRSDDFVYDAKLTLAHLEQLGVPLMAKFSVTTAPEDAVEIASMRACDAICASNTVPWGKSPERIDWKGLFGTDVSPLAALGGGGLSGAPLLPIVAAWVRRCRVLGFEKPINAGGGILGPADVRTLCGAGASSVFLGSIAMLRGWRVRKTIRAAYDCFHGKD
jgi:dihydroorotate dehydrogenase